MKKPLVTVNFAAFYVLPEAPTAPVCSRVEAAGDGRMAVALPWPSPVNLVALLRVRRITASGWRDDRKKRRVECLQNVLRIPAWPVC